MGLFDRFKKKTVSVDEMINRANRWTNIYMNQYAIQNNVDIKNGIHLFNTWVIWDYCLNNDLIEHGCHKDFLAKVLAFIWKTKDISGEEFLALYQNRFSLYKKEMRGLLSSTSHFPFDLYFAIYKNQYSLDHTKNIDMAKDARKDEMCEFTSKFINFWNVINLELVTQYKK